MALLTCLLLLHVVGEANLLVVHRHHVVQELLKLIDLSFYLFDTLRRDLLLDDL